MSRKNANTQSGKDKKGSKTNNSNSVDSLKKTSQKYAFKLLNLKLFFLSNFVKASNSDQKANQLGFKIHLLDF